MKKDFLNSPIFVTGIERSGSSIVAKIIRDCGTFSGRTTEMQENIGIKKLVDSYYKEICKIPIYGQYPLPDLRSIKIPSNWGDSIEYLLKEDMYDAKIPWMYKSSRLAQLWPIWHDTYPNAKWVIVRRRTGDILHSCLKTGFMTAYANKAIQHGIGVNSEQEGWLWWVHQHEKLFVEMIEKGLNCKIIWPERIVYNDYEQIYEMLEWLGLRWNPNLIDSISIMLKNSQRERSV